MDSAPQLNAPCISRLQVKDLAAGRLFQWHQQHTELAARADRAAWALRRAQHRPWWNRPGKGGAQGSHDALHAASRRLFCCLQCGCLTHYSAACKQARAAGRARVGPADGCNGPACSAAHQKQRFANRQRKRAHGLKQGKYQLIAVPEALRNAEVFVYDEVARVKVACLILREYES